MSAESLDIYESYRSGTSLAYTRVWGSKIWEKGGNKRRYFQLTSDDPRRGITKLWEILAGSEYAERTITVNGRLYGYETGPFANSHRKQKHIEAAVEEIINQAQEANQ